MKRKADQSSESDQDVGENNEAEFCYTTDESEREMFFSYLMINFSENQKINTHIGTSRNPPMKVEMFNKTNTARRKSKKVKPTWVLTMITGPFSSRKEAKEFTAEWKDSSRGIPSRRAMGKRMACNRGLTCWDQAKEEDKEETHRLVQATQALVIAEGAAVPVFPVVKQQSRKLILS